MPYFKADVYLENVFFIKLNFCDFSKFYMKKFHFTIIMIPSWVRKVVKGTAKLKKTNLRASSTIECKKEVQQQPK